MSDIALTNEMQALTKGRQFDVLSGVIIHAGQDENGNDKTYKAGTTSGYVLEYDNPLATQETAYSVLASLRARKWRYQPFEASKVSTDPTVEIGDNVTVDGSPSVVMSYDITHSGLMAPTLKAPYDEEIDHEFKYEPKAVREFRRETASTRARLKISNDQILSEVKRATASEGELSSRIDQRLDSITLSVSSERGTSVFTLKDGTTTLDTQTLDLSVRSANISGVLTIGQLSSSAKSHMVEDTGTIYHSVAAGSPVPDAPTAWVSTSGGSQNAWTQLRPVYSSSYPVLYVARQTKTADGTYSCSTPKLDATTTVIDGANIITGTVTASKISVSDLSALNATIGGWQIASTYLAKETDTYRIRLNAFSTPNIANNVISVATRASTSDSWATQFSVTNGGTVTCKNISIQGGSISIGGNFSVDSNGNLSANNGTFRGNVYAGNIQYGGRYGTMNGGGISPGSINTGQGGQLDSSGIGGVSGGLNFTGMENQSYTANWVVANHIQCNTGGYINGNHYGGWSDDGGGTHTAVWKSKSIPSGVSVTRSNTTRIYVTTTSGTTGSAISTFDLSASFDGSTTIYYVGR